MVIVSAGISIHWLQMLLSDADYYPLPECLLLTVTVFEMLV
jgi:hypothetical protein